MIYSTGRRPGGEPGPSVIEAEIVSLGALEPEPLKYPPAIWQPQQALCFCGNITERGHGRTDGRPGYTCEQIREMQRDLERWSQPARRRFPLRLTRRARKAGAQ